MKTIVSWPKKSFLNKKLTELQSKHDLSDRVMLDVRDSMLHYTDTVLGNAKGFTGDKHDNARIEFDNIMKEYGLEPMVFDEPLCIDNFQMPSQEDIEEMDAWDKEKELYKENDEEEANGTT